MRKIFIVGLLLLATSLFAEGIHWAKDYKSGIQQAMKEKKPVMFVISKHACQYCTQLENTTFSDKRVIEKLNKDFVSIILYTDGTEYVPYIMYKGVTPTTLFLNSSGLQMFEPFVGARGPKDYMYALQVVKDKFKEINKDGKKK